MALASEIRLNEDVRLSIFGSLHVHDASAGAQSIATGATYTKLTGFTDAGFSKGLTVDIANDKITLTRKGYYRVMAQLSFSSGTANIEWKGAAFLGGVEQDQVHFERKTSTATDIGSASCMGTINVTTVPADLDFRMAHDNGGAINFTIEYGQLVVDYLGKN